jgi:acetyl esterase
VSSVPAGSRTAETTRNVPYAAPTTAAAAQSARVRRDEPSAAYGVDMSIPRDKPALDAILQKVLEAVPFQLTAEGGPEAARQRFRDLPRRAVHPEVRAEDRIVDGPGGPIPVRLYWPPDAGAAPPPIVMFFHGGGWVVGDLDTYDGDARHHAVVSGALVVSVDYRLAPEHPHPAAVDDAWAATHWVAAHGEELGADPNRLAVAGDSAGGNLAAVIAQLARDAGGPRIAFQLLWYPATTWDTSLPSFAENRGAPILDLDAIGEFSRWYAGHVDMADAPSTLVPARATDLSGLPPAYIAVAGHDPLRDDGIRYGELLAAAGVPVEVHNAETLVHGYLGYAGVVPAATEAVDRGLDALRAALA